MVVHALIEIDIFESTYLWQECGSGSLLSAQFNAGESHDITHAIEEVMN
jgi:hypothetical protein